MEHRIAIAVLVFACFSLVNTTSSTLDKSTESEVNSGSASAPALYGGDILLTPAQKASMDTSRLLASQWEDVVALWNDARVPYVFDSSLSTMVKRAIMKVISIYEKLSCVRFVPRTNEDDYVRFYKGDGCFSMVGRVGGPQNISIGTDCEIPGIVMHEIFHSLGRWHEHSRPDRDRYVKIYFTNIIPGEESNFDKLSPSLAATQGLPYDFDSIMHYERNAFSVNGRDTVMPLDRSIDPSRLGQSIDFSQYDLQHLNALYCSDDTKARIVSKGCYYLSHDDVKLYSLEGSTPDLSDNFRNRKNAIVKCLEAAQQFGFNIFAVSLGYCISGSNWLPDYQLNPASDDRCHSGLDGRATGYITMNVYQITAARPHLNPPQSLHLTNTTGPALSHDSVADAETMQTSSNANMLLTPCTLLLLLAFCCLWL